MVILWNTQYYNKIEIRKYTNNKYYDVWYYYFLCITSVYLRMFFYLAKNRELSREINVKMCTIEKSKKIIVKNFKLIFSGTVEKLLTTKFND